jgi:cellulose synthase/poly-beta-1,6-N-acetylglucosamine synthase-like glycosyltransferase
MTRKQVFIFLGLLLVFTGGLLVSWQYTLIIFLALLTALYFADLLFNVILILRSLRKSPDIEIIEDEITQRDDSNAPWPTYTVFCPLYKEWRVIPQFIRAMSQLDYPKDRLQVMLLLEEDDRESIEHVKNTVLPGFITVAIVPHTQPKTKPKALNYGLQFATGEYCAIYDAEDVPDPQQLKKTVLAFGKVSDKTVCIQAKLNFYNPRQNLLTKLFTLEYSLWFDLILPGLQSLQAPIPLGGTSNHFRIKQVKALHGWDAFNVTEDCDLGMRLAKRGYQTAIVNSTTMEEANSNVLNWYGQRSRWVKGYIQTYLVHMRQVNKFSRSLKKPDALLFQFIVGGKVLSMIINPFMWVITISYFAFRPIVGPTLETLYPAPVLYLGVFSLVFGNFIYMYAYMIGCIKRQYYDLIKYAFLTPFYWLGMSIATWRAVREAIFNPHYWNKTVHGLHLAKDQQKKEVKKEHKTFDHVLWNYTRKRKPILRDDLPSYVDIVRVGGPAVE